ncbi:MAG: AMP-binding protein [Burkholderiales bacterium]|nr:AMP-binding protein [Burkholderiales bacterium]
MKIKASPYTRLFWTEYQLNPQRNDYNIVFDQHIVGDLDVLRLKEVLYSLVSKHILLNSHLFEEDDELYWRYNSSVCELEIFENNQNEQDFIEKPFNLETGALYRFGLFKLAENDYDLILVFHHALIDGNSFEELIALISSNYANNDSIFDALETQADKISALQQELVAKLEYIRNNGAKQFWQQALQACETRVELAYQKTNQAGTGEYRFKLDSSLVKDSLSIVDSNLFRYLISCYAYLVSRYSNAQNIHVAYPLGIKEAKNLSCGGQINTLILPFNLDLEDNIIKLMAKTNEQMKSYKLDDKHSYSYLPTAEIIANSAIRELNLAFAQTNLKDSKLNFSDCELTPKQCYNIDIAGSELLLEYQEISDSLEFRCRYDKQLFSKEFIVQFCKHYQQLIINLTQEQNHQLALAKLPLLSIDEYQRIVYDWNNTDKDYPKDKTIHQLFEEQVQRTPNNTAVVFEEQSLTYRELNQRANQLAHKIRNSYTEQTKHELQPDTLVALCLDRSLEMIIAILATLKAGAAYVPLDPEYPDDRISYILADTHAQLILTQTQHQTKLNEIVNKLDLTTASSDGINSSVKLLDIADYSSYQNEPESNPLTNTQANHLAYVIYTSGTTGKPKGVMIEHAGVVNFLLYKQQYIKPCDIMASYINYTFDAVNAEIYPALIGGNILYLLSNRISRNLDELYDYVINKEVSLLVLPSAVMAELSNYDLSVTKLSTLISGGEAYNGKRSSNIKYINQYGPTESTVCATLHKYSSGDSNTNIGKALSNIKVYVLDPNNTPVPIGVIGELYSAPDMARI